MTNGYSIEAYKKSDREEVLDLIGHVLGEKICTDARKYWMWKFENNPFNNFNIPKILLLKYSDSIVGMVSSISGKVKIDNKEIEALWLVDFIVHQDHRGHGLGLARQMLKEPYILVGTPNSTARTIWKRLKCFECCGITNYINIVRIDAVLKSKSVNKVIAFAVGAIWSCLRSVFNIMKYLPSSKNLKIAEVSGFDDQINKFWHSVSNDYEIISVRDAAYMQWRFRDAPDKKYTILSARKDDEVLGYIVFRQENKDGLHYGLIVDFLAAADDISTLDFLFLNATRILEKQKVDVITCMASVSNVLQEKMLLRNGFIFKKSGPSLLAFDSQIEGFSKEIATEKRWFVTRADSDLDM